MTPANSAKPKPKPSGPFFPGETPTVVRPRSVGLTHVLDRLHGLDRAELAPLAAYMDVVKIGWGLPLLLPRESVRARIQFYHEIGVEVSTGGTLLEHAITRDRATSLMDEARQLGFDLVEISDGIIELSPAQIERLAGEARQRSLDFFIEVGKKNPQNQLSLRETLDRIGRALALKPRKVILESRESGKGVGIYDGEGGIKWDWVRSITADYPASDLIFEAPLESQQIALLKELGAETNLGNVAIASVGPLATQRLGLRGDTFGTMRSSKPVRGPPATKFLYFLLETYRGLDQTELVRLSRLPRRTVQSGLDSLKRQGLVREGVSLVDSRRREYRLA
jgi:phosphosulfolactate synthase